MTKTSSIKIIPIKFRFPVEQISETEIEVKVSMATPGIEIAQITPEAVVNFQLTDKEVDKANDTVQEAAIRAIMIRE